MAIDPTRGAGPSSSITFEPTIDRKTVSGSNDADGVPKGSSSTGGDLPLPLLTSKPDMKKLLACFEDLIILMSKMAKEVQVGERQSELAALASKISQLLASAQEKLDGANKMQTMAIVSLVISLVAATISIIGAGVQLGGAAKGAAAANKAVDTVKKEASEGAAKAANQVINKGGSALKATEAAQKMDMGKVGKMAQVDVASKAFQKASDVTSKAGGLVDQIGRAGTAVGGYVNTQGQVDNQKAQARADAMAAAAEKEGVEATRSQQMQQDMRDLLAKLVELLNSFYAAQDKIASAASH